MKVESTVSEANGNICNIKMKNLDELKTILRAWPRLVCNKIGVIANKKECKERTGKEELKMIWQNSKRFESNWGLV